MPKVYIPNKSCHDYSNALKHGDLVALTEGNLNLSDTSGLYRQIVDKLKDSKPEDFILISGAAVVNVIATNIFAAKHKKLNLLIFQREGKYVQRNLTF